MYVRYYIDLTYLARLYNETGVAFLKYYFSKGSILSLIKYEEYTSLPKNKEDVINYYGIEQIYIKNFIPMLTTIRS